MRSWGRGGWILYSPGPGIGCKVCLWYVSLCLRISVVGMRALGKGSKGRFDTWLHITPTLRQDGKEDARLYKR